MPFAKYDLGYGGLSTKKKPPMVSQNSSDNHGFIEYPKLPGIKFNQSVLNEDGFDTINLNSLEDILKNLNSNFEHYSDYYLVNPTSQYYVKNRMINHVIPEEVFLGKDGKIDSKKTISDGASGEDLTRNDFISLMDLKNIYKFQDRYFQRWKKAPIRKKGILEFQRAQLNKYNHSQMRNAFQMLISNQQIEKKSKEDLNVLIKDHENYLSHLEKTHGLNLLIIRTFLSKHSITPIKKANKFYYQLNIEQITQLLKLARLNTQFCIKKISDDLVEIIANPTKLQTKWDLNETPLRIIKKEVYQQKYIGQSLLLLSGRLKLNTHSIGFAYVEGDDDQVYEFLKAGDTNFNKPFIFCEDGKLKVATLFEMALRDSKNKLLNYLLDDESMSQEINIHKKLKLQYKDTSGHYPWLNGAKDVSITPFGVAVFSGNMWLVQKFLCYKNFLLTEKNLKKCQFFIPGQGSDDDILIDPLSKEILEKFFDAEIYNFFLKQIAVKKDAKPCLGKTKEEHA